MLQGAGGTLFHQEREKLGGRPGQGNKEEGLCVENMSSRHSLSAYSRELKMLNSLWYHITFRPQPDTEWAYNKYLCEK